VAVAILICMSDSLFTKIIKGEIPAEKIYEDDRVVAFLDIHPVRPGHVLIVPKTEVEFVWDLEAEDYQALMAATQKIARHLRDVLGVPYVGSKIVGVDVPHAHVHLIPFSSSAEFGKVADQSAEPDNEALAEMAKKLAF
jgi:histidine triad (HIT) family protein